MAPLIVAADLEHLMEYKPSIQGAKRFVIVVNIRYMFYETVHKLINESYSPGDIVTLKHHSIKKGTPRYYKEHKAGDKFKVINRDPNSGANPKYFIKSLDTGNSYRVYSYHIQGADKPLVKVDRFEKKMSGDQECANCGKIFSLDPPEGMKHRDHCPYCLHSVHIDVRPGDRGMWCGEGVPGQPEFKPSVLEPIGRVPVEGAPDFIRYRCRKCGKIKNNSMVSDDNIKEINKLPIIQPEGRLRRYIEK